MGEALCLIASRTVQVGGNVLEAVRRGDMGGGPLCGAIPGSFRFSPGAQMTPEGGLCINRSPWALGGACVSISLADKVLWPGLQYSSSIEISPSLGHPPL